MEEEVETQDTLIARFEQELTKANTEIEVLWKVIHKLIVKDIKTW